jgi:hypothetical protein
VSRPAAVREATGVAQKAVVKGKAKNRRTELVVEKR